MKYSTQFKFLSICFFLLITNLLLTFSLQAQYVYLGQFDQTNVNENFINPISVAVDAQGFLYVIKFENNLLFKYDGSSWTHLGGTGSGPGLFQNPRSVTVDSQGNLYIADTGNHRIQKFDGTTWTSFGSYGNALGQLNQPYDVAIDKSGNLYIADMSNYRIQKYNPTTNIWTSLISPGMINNQIAPYGIAVDGEGNVYVSVSGSYMSESGSRNIDRIEKFDGTTWTSLGSYGNAIGQFFMPSGISVDKQGNLYVADSFNNRVQKFNGTTWTSIGSSGNGPGQFSSVYDVAVSEDGKLYVTDFYYNRVQILGQVLPPVIALKQGSYSLSNASSYDFGYVHISKDSTATCTVYNKGTSALILTDNSLVSLTGTNAGDYITNISSTSSTIAPGSSTSFTITFKPLAGGSRSAQLTIASNDPIIPNLRINLIGNKEKLNQSITFHTIGNKTYGDTPFALPATASSNLSINFSIVSGPATIKDNIITLTGAGLVKILASQPGDDNFNPEQIEQTITVNKATQNIIFDSISDKIVSDAPFKLSAKSSSGLPVSYTVNAGPATVSVDTLTFTRAGEITVKASQAGNENYLPALDVNQFFVVHTVLAVESNQEAEVEVFPNPTTEVLMIKFPLSAQNGSLTLFNSKGLVVIQQQLHGETIKKFNIKHLPSGLYFLQGYFQNQQFIKKIIIN